MRDLGTLGGRTSRAVAISDGIVVGSARTESGHWHAFAYDLRAAAPVMQDLGTLGGAKSTASAISHGTVVGAAETRHGGSHAFAYDLDATDPAARDLGTLGVGSSAALDVDGVVVVGWASTPLVGKDAFAYDLSRPREGMQDLRPLRGTGGDAVAVQGHMVAGTSDIDLGWMYHATAWTLGRTTRPVLAFDRVRYDVRERAGHVKVVVTRAGRTARAVTVHFSARVNADLHSFAGRGDFRATSGTLRFDPGERRASFRVAIIDDTRPEQREDLLLVLRRPSRPAELGTPYLAVVRIRANDG
jgi:probable HAF family extracellular repeat protein